MNSSTDCHLSQDVMLSMLDDELMPLARLECETHLAICEACRREIASLRAFSTDIEAAIQSAAIPGMGGVRLDLKKEIEALSILAPIAHTPGKVMRRFGWGMAIAATLAFGVLMAPRQGVSPVVETGSGSQGSAMPQATTIEVDGETFAAVPYSNADLSTSVPHIVQMQVPVSSLADMGIELEPVTNRAAAGAETDGLVLADVLVGADGQPRGVHVLGF